MSRANDQLTEQFYRWELRGRGWQVFGAPAALEPPFRPFYGHFLPPAPPIDDGRTHTFVSGFLDRLKPAPPAPEPLRLEDEPETEWREPETLVELQLTLPLSRSPSSEQIENLIRQISRGGEPLAFELLGTSEEIVPQFVASPRAASRIHRTLAASFPSFGFTPSVDALTSAWGGLDGYFAVVELGLGMEFMLPLADPRCDLLAGVVTALDGLTQGELGLLQIQFEPVWNPWPESIMASVTGQDGGPIFVNRPELVKAAQQKTASPLFGVVLRLAGCADDLSRAWEIVADMAAGFSAFSRPGTNYLVPLFNEEYDVAQHEQDIISRLSQRSGMLLNLEELSHFLTFPTAAVSRRLRRETTKTRQAPDTVARAGSLLLGTNRHAGVTREVRLSPEQRVRHMHLIGASGTGKSTLLFNLIRQDLENGQGIALLDPHGDLVDRVLGIVPPERIADVVLIDPSDEQFSVGFNILAAHSDFEKNLLASDLVSVFQRLSTSWGDQMNSVLRNAILAFLESTEGGTLADLRRFLLDPGYRNRFLTSVTDPEIVFYWQKAFPQLTGNKSIGPVVTRLDEFLSRKPIRYMVSQKENRVNFSEVLDRGRVLLAKLSQGEIGRENSYLLGSLLLSKIQQAAMSRQRMRESERRDFWCYVDEFHCFITPSMAEILTGARKYRVGLTLAHQELRQLQANDEVAGAVLANAFTRVAFRVGDADARSLENGFSHFEAQDLQNLEIGQAIARIERSDFDFNLAVRFPDAADPSEDQRREEVITASRAKYARSRTDIEAELSRKSEQQQPEARKPVAESAPLDVSETRTFSESDLSKIPEPTVELRAGLRVDEATAHPAEVPPANLKPIPEFGRGGPEHRQIQQYVKECAEKLGFHAEPEKEVLGGAGIVDVSLERDGQKIACEISMTTQPGYESAKFQMCLAAGYEAVIAIGPEKESVIEMAKAIQTKLTPEDVSRIHLCVPRRFNSVLKRLTRHVKRSEDSTPRSGSYKIKRTYSEQSPDDRSLAVEDEFLRAIGRALRGEQAK